LVFMPEQAEVLRSLHVVSQQAADARGEGPRRLAAVGAIRRIAELVDLHRAELLERHASLIDAGLLGDWDSIRVPLDVFALMRRQTREVSWTQWLASALRADADLGAQGVVWPALCSIVADELDGEDESNPFVATSEDWREAAKLAPRPEHVRDEASILVGDDEDAALAAAYLGGRTRGSHQC
jgi:hypothetical protein